MTIVQELLEAYKDFKPDQNLADAQLKQIKTPDELLAHQKAKAQSKEEGSRDDIRAKWKKQGNGDKRKNRYSWTQESIIREERFVSVQDYHKAKEEFVQNGPFKETQVLRPDGTIYRTYTSNQGTFFEVTDGNVIEFWSSKISNSRFVRLK
jgi:hypothetical protein